MLERIHIKNDNIWTQKLYNWYAIMTSLSKVFFSSGVDNIIYTICSSSILKWNPKIKKNQSFLIS